MLKPKTNQFYVEKPNLESSILNLEHSETKTTGASFQPTRQVLPKKKKLLNNPQKQSSNPQNFNSPLINSD